MGLQKKEGNNLNFQQQKELMSDIDNILDKLDGEFRFDTGQVLLNLIQYSIRNRKYLEVILRNQMEIKERMMDGRKNTDQIEEQFDEMLEDIQKEVEQEYFDLLSFLSSRHK